LRKELKRCRYGARDVNSESLGFAFIQQRAKAGGEAGTCFFFLPIQMALSVRVLLVAGCSGSSGPWTKWEAACGIKGTSWDQQQPGKIQHSSRELSSQVCPHVSAVGRGDVLHQPLLEGAHAGSGLRGAARPMALRSPVGTELCTPPWQHSKVGSGVTSLPRGPWLSSL